MIFKNWKKTSAILFAVTLVLLILYIIFDKMISPSELPQNPQSLKGFEIDSLFKAALSNYGIQPDWISKTKLRGIKGDSLFAIYKVRVPKEVSIHLLLLELGKQFWDYDVQLNSVETKFSNNTISQVYSDKSLKLACEFIYDDTIFREYGTSSFLVYNVNLSDVEKLKDFMNTPELFYIVVTPSPESKKILNIIKESGKRFALLIDGTASELKYKLSGSYTHNRLKGSIRNIAGDFYTAAFYIVDDKTDLYKSESFKFIKSEFERRGIKLIETGELLTFNLGPAQAEKEFQDFMSEIRKSDKKVFYIDYERFVSILPLISEYRKTGYKFIYPGEILLKN